VRLQFGIPEEEELLSLEAVTIGLVRELTVETKCVL
jgi:hypothetical protein